jgi:hypothetical protein
MRSTNHAKLDRLTAPCDSTMGGLSVGHGELGDALVKTGKAQNEQMSFWFALP